MDSVSEVGFSSDTASFPLVYKDSTNCQDAHRSYTRTDPDRLHPDSFSITMADSNLENLAS